MKNLGQMMKQAQEMQSKMHDMQARLADIEIIGRSGGNLVSVTLSGKNELKSLSIDPSLFNSDDLEVVEDLIVAAHADARSKVEETLQKEMQKMTGGLSLPAGMSLPF
ncbi:MAG: YbaB/EbfC family nucleoid-associated protein [Rhodospirillaceae bacterium]|nr:YbaB/EbfC family nucleoid-associated protein [Rhodospirillaceae bacterium]|tara:strand:+ start:21049 stop:21372 length:324 start_codon:yes stop_codon:yes gene_type:complete